MTNTCVNYLHVQNNSTMSTTFDRNEKMVIHIACSNMVKSDNFFVSHLRQPFYCHEVGQALS